MKAFPVTDQYNSNINEGMDLRDYFAAKAMQGICASTPSKYWTNTKIAIEAYEIADEMMKWRKL